MRLEPGHARATRLARRDSAITTSVLIIALLLIQESSSRRSPGGLRHPLLHAGMVLIVASFTFQAIGAWRRSASWPDRVMPAAFAFGIAFMELGTLLPLDPWNTVLTDAGIIALLGGVVALGADIVMMFRSSSIEA